MILYGFHIKGAYSSFDLFKAQIRAFKVEVSVKSRPCLRWDEMPVPFMNM